MNLRTSSLPLVFALGAACLFLAGGIYFINVRAIDRLLEDLAATYSQRWAADFALNLNDPRMFEAGHKPSAETLNYMKYAKASGNVYRFKIYAQSAELILDSEQLDRPTPEVDLEEGLRPESTVEAIATGKPVIEFGVDELPPGVTLISEAYVPVRYDGKIVGVAEVYMDQTQLADHVRKSFYAASGLIAGLAALGFAVPGIGLYFRTRQKQKADSQAQFLANFDTLTELPNRKQFTERLVQRLNEPAPANTFAALHLIDVDSFKDVNDRLGHATGDELLRAVGARLGSVLRSGDVISRFAGDEFAIAQFGLENDAQINIAAKRIAHAFGRPFQIGGQLLPVTAGIGTAICPASSGNGDELLRQADIAVNMVKSQGRNGHCRFEPAFDAEMSARTKLEQAVIDGLKNCTFELHFQPLVTLADSRLNGFEALLRLRDEAGKFFPPEQLIRVAEESGLIEELGAWVLDEACRIAATWPDYLQVSVNLSAVQFRRRTICLAARQALAKSGLQPARLMLEITESVLLNDVESVLDQLNQLRQLGVSIVMDDFGSGYSSLGYMLKFPFDRIKIDRSFTRQMQTGDTTARKVIQTIVALGHTLGMKVTAEGVETMAQAQALRDMRCDAAQGFLFGHPMPATDIAASLMKAFASAPPRQELAAVSGA